MSTCIRGHRYAGRWCGTCWVLDGPERRSVRRTRLHRLPPSSNGGGYDRCFSTCSYCDKRGMSLVPTSSPGQRGAGT